MRAYQLQFLRSGLVVVHQEAEVPDPYVRVRVRLVEPQGQQGGEGTPTSQLRRTGDGLRPLRYVEEEQEARVDAAPVGVRVEGEERPQQPAAPFVAIAMIPEQRPIARSRRSATTTNNHQATTKREGPHQTWRLLV